MDQSISTTQSAALIRNKKRVTHACDQCNHVRTKCDGKNPCARCSKLELSCEYFRPRKKRGKVGRRTKAQRMTSNTANAAADCPAEVTETKSMQASERCSQEQTCDSSGDSSAPLTCQAISTEAHTSQPTEHLHDSNGSLLASVTVNTRDIDHMAHISTESSAFCQSEAQLREGDTARTGYGCYDTASTTEYLSHSETVSKEHSISLQVFGAEAALSQNTSYSASSKPDGVHDGRSYATTNWSSGIAAYDFLNDNRGVSPAWILKTTEGVAVPASAVKVDALYQLLADVTAQFTQPLLSKDDETQRLEGAWGLRDLDLIPPEITTVIPVSLAIALLGHYQTDKSAKFIREQISRLSEIDFAYYVDMIPRQCTTSRSALLISVLVVAAQTSESKFVTSPPSARSKICRRLHRLAIDLLTSPHESPERISVAPGLNAGNSLATNDSENIVSWLHLVIAATSERDATHDWWWSNLAVP